VEEDAKPAQRLSYLVPCGGGWTEMVLSLVGGACEMCGERAGKQVEDECRGVCENVLTFAVSE
jgi:hypothetical protein